jgi:Ni/Fe-hydrogenase 1 B-type cytochrome subunit
MLETLNVWVDVVGFILGVVVAATFILHAVGWVASGRFKRSFIDGWWAPLEHRMHDPKQYHYRQPLGNDHTPPVRVWHWINLIAWMALLVSGFYIRYPFFEGGREAMRNIHYFFMYIFTAAFVFRMYYLYVSKAWADYFYFDREDLPWMISVLRYYGFMGPPYDHLKKLNPMQRPVYPMFWALFALQAITGFIIFRPVLAGPFMGFFGGPADVAAWMRLFHQLDARVMVLVATAHAYFGTMADFPGLQLFWFWREADLAKYDGPAPGGEEAGPWIDNYWLKKAGGGHGGHGGHGNGHGDDHGDDHGDGADHGEHEEAPVH